MSNPVERVRGKVHFDVPAERLQDQADHRDGQHQEETLNATEDIDELGECELRAAAHDVGNDANSSHKTMALERRRDIWVERNLD